MFRHLASAAIATVAMTTSASAAIDISLIQTPEGLSASYSGTLDLTDAYLYSTGEGLLQGGLIPSISTLNFAPNDPAVPVTVYSLSTGFRFTGASEVFFNSDVSGDYFGLSGLGGPFFRVSVPRDYTGGMISGEMEFVGLTLAVAGVLPGEYVFTVPNDTITLVVSEAVPLPAAGLLMIAGLGGLASIRQRRTGKAA